MEDSKAYVVVGDYLILYVSSSKRRRALDLIGEKAARRQSSVDNMKDPALDSFLFVFHATLCTLSLVATLVQSGLPHNSGGPNTKTSYPYFPGVAFWLSFTPS